MLLRLLVILVLAAGAGAEAGLPVIGLFDGAAVDRKGGRVEG